MADDDFRDPITHLETTGRTEKNRRRGWDSDYRDDLPWWGLPRVWKHEDAQDVVDDLIGIWRAQMGRLPDGVEADLGRLELYFNPSPPDGGCAKRWLTFPSRIGGRLIRRNRWYS